MFKPHVPFIPGFQVELYLEGDQLRVYHARANALRDRFKWSDTLEPVWKAYLLHSSANVPGKVAYYADIKAMMENRLTRTSPEMFLERQLTFASDEIRAAWAMEVIGQALPTISFASNTEPNLWEEVYDKGPHSCMAHSPLVRCYAHPGNNLALAYLKDGNFVSHRAIVNTKRKTYARAYGDEDEMPFFIAALNKLGYRKSYDTLLDEPIHIEFKTCSNCDTTHMMGPYLDGDYNYIKQTSMTDGIIGERGEIPYHTEENFECCSGDDEY